MSDSLSVMRDPPESRDLIPYGSDARQVVLRHKNVVVVLDPRSQQLIPSTLDPDECPYCHRPFDTSSSSTAEDRFHPEETSYVSPQYFRQLAASVQPSPASSRPVSPARRLAPLPAISGGKRVTSASSSATPAPGASAGASTPQDGSPRISANAYVQGYFDRFFIIQKELGRGGRGVVLLVSHVLDRVDLGLFACKRIPVGDSHVWLEKVLLEVTLLQNISHNENLVPYRHVWLEDFKPATFAPSSPHVFILQQYCNSGTLLDYVLGPRQDSKTTTEKLKEQARRFSRTGDRGPSPKSTVRRLHFDEIFAFFKDITTGLAHLHANGFVHRDLKPQNCLLHRTGAGLKVLVSDFGEMQGADTPRQASATGYTGTVSFAAPEVLDKDASGAFGDFTQKSDVFSLGMIVFFMCFGRLPYRNADLLNEDEDLAELKREILDWTGLQDERRERNDLPDKLYGFLKLLLSKDPAERPSTDKILQVIRAESAFSEYPTAASPHKDRFEQSEGYLESDLRSTSPDMGGVRRRSVIRGDTNAFRSFSRDKNATARGSPTPEYSPSRIAMEPVREQSSRKSAAVATHGQRPPPMLMAPPRNVIRGSWYSIVPLDQLLRACKLAIFLGKVWSLSRPCFPHFADGYLAYPLLAIAGLDLLAAGQDWWKTPALLVVHIVALSGALYMDTLCRFEVPSLG